MNIFAPRGTGSGGKAMRDKKGTDYLLMGLAIKTLAPRGTNDEKIFKSLVGLTPRKLTTGGTGNEN